jgi:Zn-dependent peptidase ImmA (M78 family)
MNLYCPDSTLESIARQNIAGLDHALLESPAPIPVETIMERVYGLTLEFQYIRNNGRVLGETVFENAMIPIYEREGGRGAYNLVPVRAGTVLIDASLINNRGDGRFRYTCAHELAHYVRHKGFFTQLGETAAMTKMSRSSETDKTIERQADRLASFLLMPKGTVKMAFYRNCMASDVTAALAEIFGVSKKAMGYRLEEMRLLS